MICFFFVKILAYFKQKLYDVECKKMGGVGRGVEGGEMRIDKREKGEDRQK